MAINTKTALANLALDHLGEPYLVDWLTDTGTTADAVRLHMDLAIENALEGHLWSFAQRVEAVYQSPSDLVVTGSAAVAGRYVFGGMTKKNSWVSDGILDQLGSARDHAYTWIFWTGGKWYVMQFAAVTGTIVYSASVTSAADSPADIGFDAPTTGSGQVWVHSVATSDLYLGVYALPEDCLRLIKIDGTDVDLPQLDFEVRGRDLLMVDNTAEYLMIDYITRSPVWGLIPGTFLAAVALLLASRLAYKLTGNPQLAATLLQQHEVALGKARSKDARETRSNENHGPRQLAARSAFVRSRYGPNRPPY